MTTLCATGKSSLDDVTPMYLWSYGNYRYEIEVKPNSYSSNSEVFEASYSEALRKFESMVTELSNTLSTEGLDEINREKDCRYRLGPHPQRRGF